MVELTGYDRVIGRFLTLASCSPLVKSVLRVMSPPDHVPGPCVFLEKIAASLVRDLSPKTRFIERKTPQDAIYRRVRGLIISTSIS